MNGKKLVLAKNLEPGQHIRIEGMGEPTRQIVGVERAEDEQGTDSIIITVEPATAPGVNTNTRFVKTPGYGAVVFDKPQSWVRSAV